MTRVRDAGTGVARSLPVGRFVVALDPLLCLLFRWLRLRAGSLGRGLPLLTIWRILRLSPRLCEREEEREAAEPTHA
ncbi:MAG: hypothetical protein SGPRY_000050 [Prymnesium sp.]